MRWLPECKLLVDELQSKFRTDPIYIGALLFAFSTPRQISCSQPGLWWSTKKVLLYRNRCTDKGAIRETNSPFCKLVVVNFNHFDYIILHQMVCKPMKLPDDHDGSGIFFFFSTPLRASVFNVPTIKWVVTLIELHVTEFGAQSTPPLIDRSSFIASIEPWHESDMNALKHVRQIKATTIYNV